MEGEEYALPVTQVQWTANKANSISMNIEMKEPTLKPKSVAFSAFRPPLLVDSLEGVGVVGDLSLTAD